MTFYIPPKLEVKFFASSTTLGISYDSVNLAAFDFSRTLHRTLQDTEPQDLRFAITAVRYVPENNELFWQHRVVRVSRDDYIVLYGRQGKDEKSLPHPEYEMRARIGREHVEGIILPETDDANEFRTPVRAWQIGPDGDYRAILPPQYKKG